jgi:hypothetical protein
MGHVLVQYVLLAGGLMGALALFLSMKREMHLTAAKNRQRLEEMATRVSEFQIQPAPEPVYIPAGAARSGLNLNKRVQAMRMVRRNEDLGTIAAALGVTRKEVELLVRVQALGREAIGRAAGK